MERILSAEERIRRAEEIYNRRKMQSNTNTTYRASSYTKDSNRINVSLFKKMFLQIIVCLVIYFIFYLIQNTNYFFSENVINKTKEILAYDINFQELYSGLQERIKQVIPKQGEQRNKIENTIQEELNPVTEENIGGAEVIEQEDIEENLSQIEIDARDIKSKYAFIKPIEGTITSRFGMRNPTTSTVPKNHTGIDIAANVGTIIYAALDGIVKISSSEGEYGNHLRIEKDDVAVYYAHCNKLYVKEGNSIKQGDPIAEVGATGNVTGPHLHFEIRKQERYVDPDLILQF